MDKIGKAQRSIVMEYQNTTMDIMNQKENKGTNPDEMGRGHQKNLKNRLTTESTRSERKKNLCRKVDELKGQEESEPKVTADKGNTQLWGIYSVHVAGQANKRVLNNAKKHSRYQIQLVQANLQMSSLYNPVTDQMSRKKTKHP